MADESWNKPEPIEVVEAVDRFVAHAHREVKTSSNITLLDESQIYSLHLTAAEVYAIGYRDGRASESLRNYGERIRRLEEGPDTDD